MLSNKFTLGIKDIAIIALLLYVLYTLFLVPENEKKTINKTQTIEVETVTENGSNNQLQLQRPKVQPAIIYKDRIVPVYHNTILSKTDLEKVKNLNKYQDTTHLENATIFSEILSDGKVYQNAIKAEIQVKTITNTIEKETIKYASSLFLSPEINFNPQASFLDNVGIYVDYINKGDFGAGIGASYHLDTHTVSLGFKLHKRLF